MHKTLRLSTAAHPAMGRPPSTWAWSGLAVLTLLLAACGGGSDSSGPATPAVDTSCQTTTASGGTVVVGSGVAGDPALPEPSSGYRLNMKPVTAAKYMVVTANPLAS